MNDDNSKKNCANENIPPQGPTLPAFPASTPDCTLKASPLRVSEYVAPRNDVEAGVAEILAELLKIERIGVNDNLILLGGESLLAAQAAWHIQNRFGCEVSLRSILAGTVANVAAEVVAANRHAEIR